MDSASKPFDVTVGDEASLETNVYRISQGCALVQYSVSVNPAAPGATGRFVYDALRVKGERVCFEHQIVMEGDDTLFSTLPGLSGKYSVQTRDGKGEVSVHVTKLGNVDSGDYATLCRVYRLVLRRADMGPGVSRFGRAWLDTVNTRGCGAFRLVSGFVPVVEQLTCGVCCAVDATSRIDRGGTMYDFLRSGISNIGRRLALCEAVQQLQAATVHASKTRIVKVTGIDWEGNPATTCFNKSTAEGIVSVSLADYFREKYGFEVQRNDPIVSTSDGKRTEMFPASALRVIGLTEVEQRGDLADRVSAMKCITTDDLMTSIDAFVMKMRDSSVLGQWGIQIGERVSVSARVLRQPSFVFRTSRPNHEFVDIKPVKMSFANELKNLAVAVPPGLNTKPVIISPYECGSDVKNKFVAELVKVEKAMGIVVHEPDVRTFEQPRTYKSEIISYIQSCGTPSFIIVVFCEDDKGNYDDVKKLLTLELGIPSQIIRSRTLFNDKLNLASVCMNIMFQITAKTGGIPYYCTPDVLPLTHTMIVGMSMSQGSSPVCAAVASYDQTLARFKSGVFPLQSTRPASIMDFMSKSMERYTQQMRGPPRRVVVFRDSDVPREEIEAIQKGIGDASLLVIGVEKRPRVRLARSDVGHAHNPVPGTVVAESLGAANRSEFLLVSHGVSPEQSVTPTRYTVVSHAPELWRSDEIVQLAYYLTCQYPNWAGSIKVPAPLMFASKLATLCQSSLGSGNPKESLSDVLHFL